VSVNPFHVIGNLHLMELTVRVAEAEDLPKLIALDAECFPSGNTDLEPAPPGEIEAGVEEGGIFLAASNALIIGMLQLDKASSNEWELLTLAIASSHRGQGVGKALMDRFLLELDRSPYLVAVSCMTSPNNLAMQGLLESYGFVQVGLMADYFGPGKHRLKFQLN
jgi:[ribosomal protein S18]-alanine N-acetyltransferase